MSHAVSVDVEALQSAVGDDEGDLSLADAYNNMLRSTRTHTSPVTAGDVADAWLRLKSGTDDPFLCSMIDACVACLVLGRLKQAERAGTVLPREAMRRLEETMREAWTAAVGDDESDPTSIMSFPAV